MKDKPKTASLRADGYDMTKLSAIEPDIFKGFAKEVLWASKGDDPGSIDEYDPNAPFRVGELRKNQEADRSRQAADKVPREDYSREVKLKQAASALRILGRMPSVYTGPRFQERLDEILGGRNIIAGSENLVPGGIPHSPRRRRGR